MACDSKLRTNEHKICLYPLAFMVNTHRQCQWLETHHYKAKRCQTNYEIVSHCHRYGAQNSSDCHCHQCCCAIVQPLPVIRCHRVTTLRAQWNSLTFPPPQLCSTHSLTPMLCYSFQANIVVTAKSFLKGNIKLKQPVKH